MILRKLFDIFELIFLNWYETYRPFHIIKILNKVSNNKLNISTLMNFTRLRFRRRLSRTALTRSMWGGWRRRSQRWWRASGWTRRIRMRARRRRRRARPTPRRSRSGCRTPRRARARRARPFASRTRISSRRRALTQRSWRTTWRRWSRIGLLTRWRPAISRSCWVILRSPRMDTLMVLMLPTGSHE